jgi:hypothetical protein
MTTTRKLSNIKKQQGFGITNVLLGIVASAAIIILGFVTYNHVMTKIKIGEAQTQFQDISTGIDQLYVNSHDFSVITTQAVIDAGIPDKTDVVGANIASPWYSGDHNSIVTVLPGAQPTNYIIEMANVPQDSCAGVASMFLNNNRNSITVNGAAVNDPAGLATACAANDPAAINITF